MVLGCLVCNSRRCGLISRSGPLLLSSSADSLMFSNVDPLFGCFRYVTYFCKFGFYECNMMHTALKVATIALAATIVESLPITDTFDDNVTVPLTCVAVGSLLFPA